MLNCYNPFPEGSTAILVDTGNVGPGSNQPFIDPDKVNIAAVFDHHRGTNPVGSKTDVRVTGATASMMWQYLKSLGFDFDSEEGKLLATALVVGIKTDTGDLTSDNVSDLDFEAYRDLIKKIERQSLVAIMKYPLPSYFFELRQKAFMKENLQIEDSTLVSGLGIISASKRDIIPIIAEEFLRMPGITTSVVFAIVEKNIDISVRSNDVSLDVSSFVQKVFGTGGGKQGAGGAHIPLDFFLTSDPNIVDTVYDAVKALVHSKVFNDVQGG